MKSVNYGRFADGKDALTREWSRKCVCLRVRQIVDFFAAQKMPPRFRAASKKVIAVECVSSGMRSGRLSSIYMYFPLCVRSCNNTLPERNFRERNASMGDALSNSGRRKFDGERWSYVGFLYPVAQDSRQNNENILKIFNSLNPPF